MEIKIYQSLRALELLTYVKADGKFVPVHFKSGVYAPKRVNGTVVVKELAVQEALENDARYGAEWKLIKGELGSKKKVAAKTRKVQESETETKTEVAETAAKIKSVPGIKTIQDAKEYLAKNVDGIDLAGLTSKDAVIDAANEAGYNFPSIK